MSARILLGGVLITAHLLMPIASAALSQAPGHTLRWSTYFGGPAAADGGTGVALDVAGNVFIAGEFNSDGMSTSGAAQPLRGGGSDVVVAKFSPAGSLLWATYFGGSGNEQTFGLAIDGGGNVCVAGLTVSTDLPIVGGFQAGFGGLTDAFVVKLSNSGAILWSSYLGGTWAESVGDLAADAAGNVYVTGRTNSTDFPLVNAFRTTVGFNDAFVAKINADGTSLAWSTLLGGADFDGGHGIAVDGAGAVYVVGETYSTDFPNAGGFQISPGAGQDGMIAKIKPDGSGLEWSSYLGGSGNDVIWDVAVDPSGNVSVTGATMSTDFPLVNAFATTFGGGFVAKVNAAGSTLAWSDHLQAVGWGLAVDNVGNVYLTGQTVSTTLPLVDAYQTTLQGGYDAFLAKISTSGSGFEWSTYLGGTLIDKGWEIWVDPGGGTIAVVGQTSSTDYPTTAGAHQTTSTGGDGFLTLFNGVPVPPGGGVPGTGGDDDDCGLLGFDVLILLLALRGLLRLPGRSNLTTPH